MLSRSSGVSLEAVLNLILGPLSQVLAQELEDETGDTAHLGRIAEMASMVAWAATQRLDQGPQVPGLIEQYTLAAVNLIWGEAV